jgi:hypothetical protein
VTKFPEIDEIKILRRVRRKIERVVIENRFTT